MQEMLYFLFHRYNFGSVDMIGMLSKGCGTTHHNFMLDCSHAGWGVNEERNSGIANLIGEY